jgi:hypothetical protein
MEDPGPLIGSEDQFDCGQRPDCPSGKSVVDVWTVSILTLVVSSVASVAAARPPDPKPGNRHSGTRLRQCACRPQGVVRASAPQWNKKLAML